MLAHKVSQHYNLSTATVGFEQGQSRVVAMKTELSHEGKVNIDGEPLCVSPAGLLWSRILPGRR